MRVALVWPWGNDITYSMPLGIGFLVANTTSPDHEIRIFDGTLEDADAASPAFAQFLEAFRPEVVGVSCWSRTYVQSLEVVRKAREILPDAVTLMGGIHPTAYPEMTIRNPEIDYLLIGECEFSFPQFLDTIAAGESVEHVPGIVYRAPAGIVHNKPEYRTDLDLIKFPDYTAIRLADYIDKGYRYFSKQKMNAPVWFTRGCPYSCNFCTAPVINGKKIRAHSVDYAMRWIKMLYHDFGIRHVNIVDDNFTFYPEYTRDFCNALIAAALPGLEVDTANGIRAQRTDFETLKVMKMAGWRRVVVAPESGSPRVLRLMKKSLKPDMWPEKVREIRKAGLKVHALFLAGYPGELPEDLELTAALIKQCKFDSIGIQYFQPMPGTPVYDDLLRDGVIDDQLLPNTTTGSRTYVTEGLKDFNFGLYALKLYLYTFFFRPMGTIEEVLSYSPALIFKRIAFLVLDAFLHVGKIAAGARAAMTAPKDG